VEPHGENPQQNVIAIIPARYESTRLPGKLLLPVGGKPLILHTLEQARAAGNVARVVVATDDERVLEAVCNGGGEAVLTSRDHTSGSDRIAEVAESLPNGSIIVNVQGDEPVISPRTIERAVDAILEDDSIDIATTSEAIDDARDVLDPNVVKVVTDTNGFALYFSRSPIPYPRTAVQASGSLVEAFKRNDQLLKSFRKHTGLYVYRREYLMEFTRLPRTRLEDLEMLEQLRALENGARIKVIEVEDSSIGVDTAEDLERVRRIIESNG
jgi:3-deoxy-manno-octulosonate cytidylyltransferase (CMP-KDO synthetase)